MLTLRICAGIFGFPFAGDGARLVQINYPSDMAISVANTNGHKIRCNRVRNCYALKD